MRKGNREKELLHQDQKKFRETGDINLSFADVRPQTHLFSILKNLRAERAKKFEDFVRI